MRCCRTCFICVFQSVSCDLRRPFCLSFMRGPFQIATGPLFFCVCHNVACVVPIPVLLVVPIHAKRGTNLKEKPRPPFKFEHFAGVILFDSTRCGFTTHMDIDDGHSKKKHGPFSYPKEKRCNKRRVQQRALFFYLQAQHGHLRAAHTETGTLFSFGLCVCGSFPRATSTAVRNRRHACPAGHRPHPPRMTRPDACSVGPAAWWPPPASPPPRAPPSVAQPWVAAATALRAY